MKNKVSLIILGNKYCVLNNFNYKQTHNSLINKLYNSPDVDFILHSNDNKYKIIKDNCILSDSLVKEIF